MRELSVAAGAPRRIRHVTCFGVRIGCKMLSADVRGSGRFTDLRKPCSFTSVGNGNRDLCAPLLVRLEERVFFRPRVLLPARGTVDWILLDRRSVKDRRIHCEAGVNQLLRARAPDENSMHDSTRLPKMRFRCVAIPYQGDDSSFRLGTG